MDIGILIAQPIPIRQRPLLGKQVVGAPDGPRPHLTFPPALVRPGRPGRGSPLQ